MARVYVGNLDPGVTARELEDEFRLVGVLRRSSGPDERSGACGQAAAGGGEGRLGEVQRNGTPPCFDLGSRPVAGVGSDQGPSIFFWILTVFLSPLTEGRAQNPSVEGGRSPLPVTVALTKPWFSSPRFPNMGSFFVGCVQMIFFLCYCKPMKLVLLTLVVDDVAVAPAAMVEKLKLPAGMHLTVAVLLVGMLPVLAERQLVGMLTLNSINCTNLFGLMTQLLTTKSVDASSRAMAKTAAARVNAR